jgi:hypothetical protein
MWSSDAPQVLDDILSKEVGRIFAVLGFGGVVLSLSYAVNATRK